MPKRPLYVLIHTVNKETKNRHESHESHVFKYTNRVYLLLWMSFKPEPSPQPQAPNCHLSPQPWSEKQLHENCEYVLKLCHWPPTNSNNY